MNYVKQVNSKTQHLHNITSREALVKTFCQNARLAKTIQAVRNAETEEEYKELKPSLPAYLFQGKLDEDLYKEYQDRCQQQKISKRRQESQRCTCFLRPTGLFMMDFDRDTDCAKALYEQFLTVMKNEGIDPKEVLAMAHRTVRGNGLRLVLKRRIGHTIEEDQQWLSTLMNEPIDERCKDIARLSFMVPCHDILYINPDILLDDTLGEAFTNEGLWQPHQPLPIKEESRGRKKKSASKSSKSKTQRKTSIPTTIIDYQRLNRLYPPISHIDEENLIKDLVMGTERHRKQVIKEGNRNSSYFDMALALLGLLNDLQLTIDLLIKASSMCGHGLSEYEITKAARSAAKYTDNPFVPYYLCKYINNGTYRVENMQMAS